MVQHIFHGGCRNCTQQEINGLDFCTKCQYFDANWELPNLNNHISSTEQIKIDLKIKNNIKLNERDIFIIEENICKKEEENNTSPSSLPLITSSDISSDNDLNSFIITRHMLYRFLLIFCLTLVILIIIYSE